VQGLPSFLRLSCVALVYEFITRRCRRRSPCLAMVTSRGRIVKRGLGSRWAVGQCYLFKVITITTYDLLSIFGQWFQVYIQYCFFKIVMQYSMFKIVVQYCLLKSYLTQYHLRQAVIQYCVFKCVMQHCLFKIVIPCHFCLKTAYKVIFNPMNDCVFRRTAFPLVELLSGLRFYKMILYCTIIGCSKFLCNINSSELSCSIVS
jgi:hypothetical protein